ncbi:hypothetical protein [Ralstonia pickettii]|uniref:hypothetical protein n=1 Tax=Cupriavidus sp. DF5525 TaxID=3160989 RepID=UPI0003B080CB|nr:hypothetical protein N234_28785 [Ralstonia pickettii DTP0602]
MDLNQQKYRDLCEIERSIPFSSQAWWLDATVGPDRWSATLVERAGKVIAAMPYVKRTKYGFVILTQPPAGHGLGPWLACKDAKPTKLLSQQKELMTELIEQLPRFDHFAQAWHYSDTNWLPFFWKGYRQTTKYTYILPDLSDETSLWSAMQPTVKQDIRKATGRFNLRVRHSDSIDEFLPLNRNVGTDPRWRRGYSDDVARRIDAACKERGKRKIFIVEDEEGRAHYSAYLVWDERSAYGLMGGANRDMPPNTGAGSYCIWETIRFAATVTRIYDFSGSMLETVERFFRGFGAVQRPYFLISKTPSRALSLYQLMRSR